MLHEEIQNVMASSKNTKAIHRSRDSTGNFNIADRELLCALLYTCNVILESARWLKFWCYSVYVILCKKRCTQKMSNCRTISLILYVNVVMLKILHASLSVKGHNLPNSFEPTTLRELENYFCNYLLY